MDAVLIIYHGKTKRFEKAGFQHTSIFQCKMSRTPLVKFRHSVKPHQRKNIGAITHQDGTCRIQTVNSELHPEVTVLLEEYNNLTGCPILLNTSLNIKGKPMVNDEKDARSFAERYGVKVCVS